MPAIIQTLLKILAAAGLSVLAFFVLFALNALRIAVCAYVPRPIRKYYRELSQKEGFVPYQKIPASASILLIALEDLTFPKHHGVNFMGIVYAIEENRRHKLSKEEKWGGSSITQQLVKNLYLYPKKTYTRKLAELFLSLWIEGRISKRQILALYFNCVYYGRSQYGLGAAAQHYFGTEPRDLSTNQLITLISILPCPDLYNPLDDPALFQKVRQSSLQRLQALRCITPEFSAELAAMPWNASSGSRELTIVRSDLTKNPCYRQNRTSTEAKYADFHQNGPRGLMLHSVGCARSDPYGFLQQWNSRHFADACVHAFIDANDGAVYQTLPWNFRGWHCGGAANNTHVGVEMCESEALRYTGGADFEVLDRDEAVRHARRAYDAAVRLFALLGKTYHLQTDTILSHREGCALGVASDHKDPEHLWEGLGLEYSMDRFRADVASRMRGEPLFVLSGPPCFRKYLFLRWLHGRLIR